MCEYFSQITLLDCRYLSDFLHISFDYIIDLRLYFQESANNFKSSANTSTIEHNPPVLTTESVHINLSSSPLSPTHSAATAQKPANSGIAIIDVPPSKNASTTTPTNNMQGMRTIELSTGRVREGFGE